MLGNSPKWIGIDLCGSELRAVIVQMRAGRPIVASAIKADAPPAAVIQGQIHNSAVLSVALRRLLDQVGESGATRAVVGIASDLLNLRPLVVPDVPDAEIPSVVAADVEHFQLVQSKGASYGFIRIHPPVNKEPGQQVVVFSGEEQVFQAIRETTERAALSVQSLEPTSLAMLRAAYQSRKEGQPLFVLMVSDTSSDVALVVGGRIAAYRRIDVGSLSLIGADRIDVHRPEIVPSGDSGDEPVRSEAADRLALEVRRTLDYLQREYPETAVCESLHVVVNRAQLGGLSSALSERLGVETNIVSPASADGSSSVPQEFATAFGLAMANAQTDLFMERLDLFTTQRSVARREASKRNFAGSIAVSVIAILFGVVGYFLYNNLISKAEQETKAAETQSAAIENQLLNSQADKAKRERQYVALRKEGLPSSEVIDEIVARLAPGVTLTALDITPDLKVVIKGDAVDEQSIIQTTQNDA